MGAHFAGTNLRIDRIISSTAARALATARLFLEAFDDQTPLTSRRDLFHAGPKTLLSVALEEAGGDEDSNVMLVGHNPGMHDLARFLCSEGQPGDVARLNAKFPTGALAEFDLKSQPLAPSQTQLPAGRLVRFVRPKDLATAKELRL